MLQYNEYFLAIKEVNILGYSINSPEYIPQEYLNREQFLIFRTCHSYGDWVILSAMPRLLKQKYPNCIVMIPSPECIAKYYSPNNWQNKHENPFNNVIEIFKNNPYVDGMIDQIPEGMPVYHDHFRIYDEKNPHIPLVKQILKFWKFSEDEIVDCEPELYWTEEEVLLGTEIINKLSKGEDFGFLYIDDDFFYSINMKEEEIQKRRDIIQKEILKYDLLWIYFSGNQKFNYITHNRVVDIKSLNMSLRIQNYVKSKAKVIIGHQGGYGTDCMSRYSKCYVVPLNSNDVREHIQLKTTYLHY